MASRTLGVIGAALALAACGGDGGVPDAIVPRVVDDTAVIGANGRSDLVQFEVPPATRSIAITVTGAREALYALAELTLADGIDRVALPDGAPGPAMTESYYTEQIGQMPGQLYQSIRLGTFMHVYPYRPDQSVPAGHAGLRVASDMTGTVAVRIAMVADDGATELTINLITVSDTLAIDGPGVIGEVATYIANAGIATELGMSLRLTGTPLADITDFNEPQETPTSQSAQLPALVRDQLGAAAGVDVFVVESMPAGIGGLSLGTPGPPERGGYYYGVVVHAGTGNTVSGRVIAHEVCHFLGLQHVQNTGVSGTVYPDPIDDTAVGEDNLMSLGTALTADQGWVLRHSPVLGRN
jgi:hypothetical protein